jgi:hypothetical protein
MRPPTDPRSPETSNDVQKIGKWSRTYAQNRSLGFVVFLVIYLILTAAIGLPSYFGGWAYREGQWTIFWVCIAILIAATVALVYFSMPWWGGRLMERITSRLYADEGMAQLAPQCSRGRRWVGALLVGTFMLCIFASVVLGFLGVIPHQYMQPVSAIYMVPFLVGLWLLMRPAIGPILFLWPALYALHAVLMLAGAPIRFVGPWDGLNMLIPTVGYGLVTGLIAHLYSRLALRKLRHIAGGAADEAAEGPQS